VPIRLIGLAERDVTLFDALSAFFQEHRCWLP
jgi:hypothetical protein